VQGSGQNDAAVWASLARAALVADPEDTFAREVLARPAEVSAVEREDVVSYLSAILEDGLYGMPETVSSYESSLAELRARDAKLRTFALVALALSGLALVATIGRRGFAASVRATEILTQAGLERRFVRRSERRGDLSVLVSSLLLLLLFSLIAIYVIVRART
jgi:hypothetical protein